MIFGVVYLLGVSSSIWSGVAFVPKLYAIQVVNEFPHDPSAFTQVNPFLGFLCFCLIWLYCLYYNCLDLFASLAAFVSVFNLVQ